MLKARHSIYQPGRRGLAWLKLKRELATLDVVVTAAEYGHGRRAGWLSDYTFAVSDGEVLRNVGKAYSGVTDAEIARLTQFFLEHTVEDYGSVRAVEPLVVLEVAFNNVMRSDRHDSGFALRFPRILRIRDDKPVSEIDTLERVAEIYQSQPDKPVETAEGAGAELRRVTQQKGRWNSAVPSGLGRGGWGTPSDCVLRLLSGSPLREQAFRLRVVNSIERQIISGSERGSGRDPHVRRPRRAGHNRPQLRSRHTRTEWWSGKCGIFAAAFH